jgi:branched-chain amino acid transport system substrate-binding protein
MFLLLAHGLCLSGAEPTNTNATSPTPFLRLRETTLGYHGSDSDFTNLTEIRIGWFGPHAASNNLAKDMWWAANLALREANDRGGLSGLPFHLVARWAVDPWGTGVSQLTRMVYDEQPLALIGSVDSASTHLAEQVVAKANLPLVSPISTDKSVSLAGVSWMFSCAPADDAIARVLVAEVLATLPDITHKLTLVACTDHESRLSAREVLRELSSRHRQPDFRFDVPARAPGIAQQMAALVASRPAAVIIIAGVEDAARLVAAIRESLPAALIYGNQSMSRTAFLDLAGRSAEGVRFPLLFVADPADTGSARFVGQFTAEHGHAPDYTAALTYDASRLLIEAIRRAGPNRARIRESLKALSPCRGIAGSICFDGTGQNTRTNIVMGTIRSGALAPLYQRRNGTSETNQPSKS